jgi:tRNA A-37 threonylcarbamoyl transferase component Bud32
VPQRPDDEPKEPAQSEGSGEQSFDPLLLEAAKALDPSGLDPPLQRNDGATLASESRAPRLTAGTLIAGRYRLDQRLGEGGMGEVWAATHAITRRRVAMKFLRGSTFRRAEMHQRFLREARAVSLVRHPSVVDVLDVFELEAGVPVMVMDLLVGETLGAKLARDGPLPVGQVASLILPAVEALEAAHARGIVHRDVKPDNIFLEAGEGGGVIVKVLDFGIAKLTAKEGDEAETGPLTGTGSVLGTPWYMAPEQLSGEKDIDPRADVWALGVILYECLSGRRPLDGSNVAQLVTQMLRGGIVPIEERVPGLSPELTRLVGRMLAREREDRPRDLAEVREVLARHGEGVASGPPLAMGSLRIAPAPHVGQGLEVLPTEEQKLLARWDTGVPHAVPNGRRASRPFGMFRIPAALATVATVVVVAWAVVRSTWHRSNQAAAEDSAVLTTSVAATRALDVAESVRPPPAAGAAASIVAAPPGPATPEPPSLDVASAFGNRLRQAAPSRPNAIAVPHRAYVIADAGMTAGENAAALASASAQPVGSAQPKPQRGGLFEAVPF